MRLNQTALIVVGLLAVILVGVAAMGYWKTAHSKPAGEITSFEECVAAGYPVMESYPEQCMTPEGLSFTRQVSNQNNQNPAEPPTTSAPAASISPASPTSQSGQGEVRRIKGTIVCLPHRDQTGPQTMECAYGLQAEDGTYYGLRDSDPTYQNLMGLPTGEVVVITGRFTPQTDTQYQSIGLLEIQSVER